MKNELDNIWIGDKDLAQDAEFIAIAEQEFANTSLVESMGNEEVAESFGGNRRDFLKFLGFGLGAATVAAGCDIPVKRAIPYVIKPEEIVPGVATYYASTIIDGGDCCPVLVKTREGRPIKIEGNALSSMTKGGTSARAQASVLSLYDTTRYKGPQIKDDGAWSKATWRDVDKAIMPKLIAGGQVRVVTNTMLSPTAKKALGEFTSKYPNAKVVTYDPVSASALLDANEQAFGMRVVPDYHFDKADIIVSFNADFLGTWISPVEYAADFAVGRKISDVDNPQMSRLIQVESHMSLTGSNADNRILVRPSEQGVAIAYLYSQIVGGGPSSTGLNGDAQKSLKKVANDLKANAGKSIVVSASNNVTEQMMVNAINNSLSNYGSTIGMDAVSMQRQGDDKAMEALVAEMNRGSVDVVIFDGANPCYDYSGNVAFNEALTKVGTKVSTSTVINETSDACDIVAPSHHILESWGDAEAKRGHLSLIQPTISPLFKTRQSAESFLVWAGSTNLKVGADQPYYEYLKDSWKQNAFASQSKFATFRSFWDNALHDGVVEMPGQGGKPSFSGTVSGSISKVESSKLEISFYETVNIGNGQYGGNPWLQEMPDPVTRTVWGNYLSVPIDFDGNRSMVGFNGLEDGDLVELTVGEKTMTVPVVRTFGQMSGTVALALGYGRRVGGLSAKDVGINVNDCLTMLGGSPQYYNHNVSVSNKIGKEEHFSCVQYHHTFGVKSQDSVTGDTINADEAALGFAYGQGGYQGALTDRSVVYNSNVTDLKANIKALQKKRSQAQHLNEQQIYGGFDELYETGHHWGMHVDLSACIGCGACTVACMAENNVPVVGKKEVSRHHEMTWLRIDRYFYGDIKNPNVVYQPMMCQHCDNAPCENVCPVNATNHSSEGLNQMTYNRCVGTRYCANNCPYKVRRFNWLDYTTADLFPANQPGLTEDDGAVPYGADNLTRMVLNPDVTVRARGVIEKCSFCVQRLQEGKLTAKKDERRLKDSDVKTACQTACPTGAITFGDMNNKGGELDKKLHSPLNYIALEEVNVRSSVNYTMRVNNRDESLDA